jgi:hypothetical protein
MDLPMTLRPLTDADIQLQHKRATARTERARTTGRVAAAARYLSRTHRLVLSLGNGTQLSVPVPLIPVLAHASPRELAAVEISPTGTSLRWEALDVDLSVPALVHHALGARTVMQVMGAAGGSARSARKAEASKTNGAKGGRPRKAR